MAVALQLKEEVAVGEDSGSEAKSSVWREGSHCPVFDHHLDLDERSRGLRTTLWHYKSTSPLRGGVGSHSFTGAATPGFSTARAATHHPHHLGVRQQYVVVHPHHDDDDDDHVIKGYRRQ